MKKLVACFPALLLILSCSSQSYKPVMFGGNAAHTQVYQSSFNGQPKEFAWSFKTGGAVRSTPLFSDGRVFFGSADKNFYAIDSKNGDLIWKIETI